MWQVAALEPSPAQGKREGSQGVAEGPGSGLAPLTEPSYLKSQHEDSQGHTRRQMGLARHTQTPEPPNLGKAPQTMGVVGKRPGQGTPRRAWEARRRPWHAQAPALTQSLAQGPAGGAVFPHQSPQLPC